MRTSSVLSRFAAVIVLAVSTVVVGQAPASAQSTPVAGGMPVSIGGDSICTLTAAGHSDIGTPVAFTAGHCTQAIGEPAFLPTPDGDVQIGHVVARNETLDYAVIELSPNAVPAPQQGVGGVAPVPNIGDEVCKVGASTGHTCGITWASDPQTIWNHACAGPGDSGGPVMAGDRLVGLLSGGGIPPEAGLAGASLGQILPPCYHPIQSPFFLPGLAYSFDAIVADVTERGWPGAGFTLAA